MVIFKTEKVSEHITRIYGINTELIYLVEGNQKAALIDTGSGFGSLKEVVCSLTKKPLLVIVTHGHTDHAMGAGEFQEVYMNHKDDYIYRKHGDKAFRWDGMKMSQVYHKLEADDYIETVPLNNFHDLKAGDSFDLGGIHLDIYECPGHTLGSMVILIREERTLLTGDACNNFTFLFEEYSLPIARYQESLEKLKKEIDGKYDKILLSHGDGVGPSDIIEGVIKVCMDIKQGNTDDINMEFRGTKGLIAKELIMPQMLRKDGGHGNIVYNKDRIY